MRQFLNEDSGAVEAIFAGDLKSRSKYFYCNCEFISGVCRYCFFKFLEQIKHHIELSKAVLHAYLTPRLDENMNCAFIVLSKLELLMPGYCKWVNHTDF